MFVVVVSRDDERKEISKGHRKKKKKKSSFRERVLVGVVDDSSAGLSICSTTLHRHHSQVDLAVGRCDGHGLLTFAGFNT